MGHCLEGITVPADKPQKAVSRDGLGGCRTCLGGSSGWGDIKGKRKGCLTQ